jgi:hypothetical protein
MRFSIVCDESKSSPISGIATFATDRFRFATVATAMSDARTRPARSGRASGESCVDSLSGCPSCVRRSYGARGTCEINRVRYPAQTFTTRRTLTDEEFEAKKQILGI